MAPELASARPSVPPPRRSLLANSLLFVASLIASLVAAELVLRLVIKPRAVMTRQLLFDLGVTDSDQNWQRDAELGWMIKPSASFRHTSPFGEFDQEIRTDELGLRIPLHDKQQHPGAERTILFVGDSATAAYEVAYEDTFVAQVETALNAAGQRVHTLNAAIRGYSTEQSYKRMLRLLQRPELAVTDVVYQYSLNDPFENMSLHFPKRLMSKPGAYLDEGGELRFRTLDEPVGVFDSEAHFVEPNGSVGVLPVVGRTSTPRWVLGRRLRYKEARDWFDNLYLVGLVRVALEMGGAPRDVEIVRTRYPYIKAEYMADSFGGYMPGFIDVTWEPGSYPLRLLEEIIRRMKAETDRRGIKFWLSLPLSMDPKSLPFFREISAKYGIALIDPVSDGLRDRLVTQCGGTLVFKTDGHYTGCGHVAQAEPLIKALAASHRSR